MSQNIHETESPAPKSTGLISDELKKMLVLPLLTFVLTLSVSWFQNQRAQDNLSFQTQANKEAIAVNSANIKANADALNQIVISMAKFSEAQARIAQDLKQLQDDQRYNSAQMNRQR